MNTNTYKRVHIHDIHWIDFRGEGHLQNGVRPGLVIQNESGNAHSPTTIVFPITTSIKNTWMPTHVTLDARSTGLPKDSMVLCESPTTINLDQVGDYITTLPLKDLLRIKKAVEISIPVVDLSMEGAHARLGKSA